MKRRSSISKTTVPIQKGDKTTVQKQYSNYLMRSVRQSMGLDEDDTSRDDAIMEMDSYELLDRFLEWEGIIGYTQKIVNILKEIFPNLPVDL